MAQKRIDHPTAGRMLFEYSSLGVGDPPDMKLIVFTPLEDEERSESWTGFCATDHFAGRKPDCPPSRLIRSFAPSAAERLGRPIKLACG